MKGTVLFSAKGTGSVVSAIEIVFQIWHKPRGSNHFVRFVDKEGKVDGPDLIGGSEQASAAANACTLVTEEVLRPLWSLESEVWAKRVAELKGVRPSRPQEDTAEADAVR